MFAAKLEIFVAKLRDICG